MYSGKEKAEARRKNEALEEAWGKIGERYLKEDPTKWLDRQAKGVEILRKKRR